MLFPWEPQEPRHWSNVIFDSRMYQRRVHGIVSEILDLVGLIQYPSDIFFQVGKFDEIGNDEGNHNAPEHFSFRPVVL